MGRSKRLEGSLTRPPFVGPPEGGRSALQIHLIQAAVCPLFLPFDVLAYHRFVSTDVAQTGPRKLRFFSPYTRANINGSQFYPSPFQVRTAAVSIDGMAGVRELPSCVASAWACG